MKINILQKEIIQRIKSFPNWKLSFPNMIHGYVIKNIEIIKDDIIKLIKFCINMKI